MSGQTTMASRKVKPRQRPGKHGAPPALYGAVAFLVVLVGLVAVHALQLKAASMPVVAEQLQTLTAMLENPWDPHDRINTVGLEVGCFDAAPDVCNQVATACATPEGKIAREMCPRTCGTCIVNGTLRLRARLDELLATLEYLDATEGSHPRVIVHTVGGEPCLEPAARASAPRHPLPR